MIRGMASLYETDPDFHHTFGAPGAARLAAQALRLYVGSDSSDNACD